jgi:hypothetical protein
LNARDASRTRASTTRADAREGGGKKTRERSTRSNADAEDGARGRGGAETAIADDARGV